MAFHTWLAFVAASAVLLFIPGPTVLLVIGYALSRGARVASLTAIGVALGDATAMSASLAGLGLVLSASATLFTVFKLAGAAYLVYLGLRMWRAAPAYAPPAGAAAVPPPKSSRLAMIGHAYVVTATNPKSIAFFLAFVPQFVNHNAPAGPQLAVLLTTFVVMAFANVLMYAYLAGGVRRTISRPGVIRAIHRTGGGLLIGAGVWTALKKAA